MGASFARTDAQKKQHRERAQPFNRARYGLLEKKGDYRLRAADFAQKQARLKTLRTKAANKNEDEFYFGMIKARTRGGVAVKDRRAGKTGTGTGVLSQVVTRVLKTQDAGYLKTVAAMERKKVEALRESQHIPRSASSSSSSSRDADKNGIDDDDDEDESDENGRGQSGKRHAVFVDTAEELVALDPVKRLHTTQANLHRAENRLPDVLPHSTAPEARRERKRTRMAKSRAERELASRVKRVESLRVMERETEVQRHLQGKGARRKVGVDKDGVAKYKWKQERKR